jgi:glycosyltransferase involved in cell wall biosynthesis
MPKFCIVIPASDSATTLRAAIASGLAQQHNDFCVVVSDNASTDDTKQVMERFADSRLHIFSHAERVGKSANWNRAYAHAPDCEFYVNLHSDDMLDPFCLAQLASAIDRTGADIVHGGFTAIDHQGKAPRKRRGFPFAHTATGEPQQEIMLLGNIVCVVGFGIRRQSFVDQGGWPDRFTYMQDSDFWHRACGAGARFHYTPGHFGYYRDLPPSAAGKRMRQQEEELTWYLECWQTARTDRLRSASALGLVHVLKNTNSQSSDATGRWPVLEELKGRAISIVGNKTRSPRSRPWRQRYVRLRAALASL